MIVRKKISSEFAVTCIAVVVRTKESAAVIAVCVDVGRILYHK